MSIVTQFRKEAWACLLIGSTFCFLTYGLLCRIDNQRIQTELEHNIDNIASALFRNISLNFEATRSLALMFTSDNTPSYEVFNQHANHILQRHSGVESLQWQPRISHEQRTVLELDPDFVITELNADGELEPAAVRKEYFPVYYITPLEGHDQFIGMNPHAEVSRANTMALARNSGIPRASEPLQLLQSHLGDMGLLTHTPVFSGNPHTAKERQRALKGYIAGSYSIGELFHNSLAGIDISDIKTSIIDATNSHSKPLYQRLPTSDNPELSNYTYSTKLPEFWGRRWTLQAQATQSYISKHRGYFPLAVLLCGLALTGLVSWLVHLILTRANITRHQLYKKNKALNEANRKLEILSENDTLTGLANRRSLERCLLSEWSRASRTGTLLSCLAIDIDHFKTYNENYGHPQGDVCLRRIATTLRQQAGRNSDLVTRYSGEKFVMLLPETNNAQWIAKKCLKAIRALHIPHGYSPISDKVTVSIGLSTMYPSHEVQPQRLIESAQNALQRAKKLGRNRIQINSAGASKYNQKSPVAEIK